MTFPRLHLFELEDQSWLPSVIRDLATEYLSYVQETFRLERPILPVLIAALRRTGCRQIVDLCSGGGAPMLSLQKALTAEGLEMHITLTDKFPNLRALQRAQETHKGVCVVPVSVDARSVPAHLQGFRTIFNSFHHFAKSDAQEILRHAVRAGQPIAVFEYPERNVIVLLLTMILTPLLVVLTALFIRPFRVSRLFFTYVVPLVPFICWWDGIVSHLRAYTVAELKALTHDLGATYQWHAGRIRLAYTPAHLTYLVGWLRG